MIKSEDFLIYVVEDEPFFLENLLDELKEAPNSYPVQGFEDLQTFKTTLAAAEQKPHVVCLDYQVPLKPEADPEDLDLSLIEKIKQESPDTEIIIISQQPSIETAVALLNTGAYDYITKEEDFVVRLENVLNKLRKQIFTQTENETLKERTKILQETISGNFQKIIGKSSEIEKTKRLIEKLAPSPIDIMITGENGVGKELVAQAIHENSARKEGPFIAVNIAALSKDLITSELFGHEKGAFTSADSKRIGKFEAAKGGTLFLDEIGEAELTTQVKLLRVLDNKELSRMGSNKLIKTDCRIVTATNKDLKQLVKEGKFREDLYFRLNGANIHVAPLRERKEDIISLAKFFIRKYCEENQLPQLGISEAAREKLLSYYFPGNIRELKKIMERAVAFSINDADEIEADNIWLDGDAEKPLIILQEKNLSTYLDFIYETLLRRYNDNSQTVADILGKAFRTINDYKKRRDGISD